MITALLDTSQGLEANYWTWILALLLTCIWLASLRLIKRTSGVGWAAVPMSLFGWMWLGFGVHYVLRFWVLSVDSVTYGNSTARLAVIPSEVVNISLTLTLLFWIVSCGMYLVASRSRSINPLKSLPDLPQVSLEGWTDALSVVACAAVMTSALWDPMPGFLLRPIGIISSLWIVPAVIAWMQCAIATAEVRPPRVRRWLFLMPGVLFFIFVPYREYLLLILLIPFITALYVGRRMRLASSLVLVLIFGVAGTLSVATYRQMSWGGYSAREAAKEAIEVSEWIDNPAVSPWGKLLQRFHSFDSVLLTTNLVPRVLPFEEENLFVDVLVETFVPRAFYPEKPDSVRAKLFSTMIWGYGDPDAAEANIAPSIVGNLYSYGGIHWVLIGGALWGLLLGALERQREGLLPAGQAVVVCYLALLITGGVERDFPRAVATIVQSILVLYAAVAILTRGTLWRRRVVARPQAALRTVKR